MRIGFDPRLALFSAINFLIFFVIVNKFLISKVSKSLKQRQIEIEQSLLNAQKLEVEMANAKERSEKIIAEANKEANSIIISHQKKAEKQAAEIKFKAMQDVATLHDKLTAKLESQKNDLVKNIRNEAAEIAVKAAEKIIKQNIDREKDIKIIKTYLKDV